MGDCIVDTLKSTPPYMAYFIGRDTYTIRFENARLRLFSKKRDKCLRVYEAFCSKQATLT